MLPIINKKKLYITFALFFLLSFMANAGVYFITTDDNETSSGDTNKPCFLDYPLFSCPEGKQPKDLCPTDSRYFKSCGCDETIYKYTVYNCANNKSLMGNQCDNKYEACACNTSIYKYDASNCYGGRILSGNICDNKYDACGCAGGYTKKCDTNNLVPKDATDSCDGYYNACKCPDNFIVCKNDEGADGADKCIEENGTIKFSECKEDEDTEAKCEDENYKSYVPENNICTQITYEGKTCYKDCRAATCTDGGYEASIPSGKECTEVTYAGKTCYKNCAYDCSECSVYYGDAQCISACYTQCRRTGVIPSSITIGGLLCAIR